LFRRDYKYITGFFKQTHINIAIGMLLFTLFAGTIVFYIVEHGNDPSVHTIWDSMWFTITIMLTGNSAFNPDTQIGKVTSVIIIIIGISFVGILTASLASWLISKSNKIQNDKEEERLKNIETSMDEIKNEIIELKKLLKDRL
jgi:voltage-gated potassium channel